MAHHGTLGDFNFADSADDIRGSDLYGRDNQKLGEICDVVFDHNEITVVYAVVDSGGWLPSNRFLIPANRLRTADRDASALQVGLERSHIELFPPYDEKLVRSERDWKDYEQRYLESWRHACDIAGTELAITGEMDELCKSLAAEPGASSGETPGLWQRFKNLLRRHRTDLQQRCPQCRGEHKEKVA